LPDAPRRRYTRRISPEASFDPETAVTVGRIVASHGVRGELKVEPLTAFPERFARGSKLWLKGALVTVAASRPVARLVYVTLAGVDDRTKAEALKGESLLATAPQEIKDADTYYQHDIVGLQVETEAGEALGKVESIFSTGSNDVYVVRGERGELLLPAIEDVVKQVDVAGGRLVVALLPGLEFQKSAPKAASPRPKRRAPAPKRG